MPEPLPTTEAPATGPPPVTVRTASGELGTVDASELDQAVRAGMRPVDLATEQAADARDYRPTAGEMGNGLAQGLETAQAGLGYAAMGPVGGYLLGGKAAQAFGKAGLAGATGHLSDAAAYKALGLYSPEAATQYKEQRAQEARDFPLASGVGYMGGMAGGALTGGAALGALGKGLGIAGEAATSGAAAAEGGLSNAAWRVASGTASAMGQQIGQNVAEGVSEDVLGDVNVTGEKVLSYANPAQWNVLLAGGLGVGLGALGEGFRAVRGANSGLLENAGRVQSGAVADEVSGVAGTGVAVQRDARAASKAVDELMAKGLTDAEARAAYAEADNLGRAQAQAPPPGQGGMGNQPHMTPPATSWRQPSAQPGVTGFVNGHIDTAMEELVNAHGGPTSEIGQILQSVKAGSLTSAVERKAVMEGAISELHAAGNEALRHGMDAADEVAYGLKPQVVRANITGDVRTVLDRGNEMRADAKAFMEYHALRGSPEEVATLKKLRPAVAFYEKELDHLASRGLASADANPEATAKMYLLMDNLKRDFQKASKFGERFGGLTDPFPQPGMRPMGARDISERMRVALEDTGTFGKIGEIQAANNKSFSSSFQNRKVFLAAHTQELSTAADGTRVPEMNSASVASLLENAGNASGATQRKVVTDFIDNQIAYISGIEQHTVLDAAQRARFAKGKEALYKMRSVTNDAVARAQQVKKIEAQLFAERESPGTGGIAGMAVDIAMRPVTTMQRLMKIKEMTNRASASMQNAAKAVTSNWGSSTAYRGAMPGPSPVAAATEAAGARAAAKSEGVATSGLQMSATAKQAHVAAVAQEIAGVKAAAASPEVLAARTSQMIGPALHGAAPKVSTAVASTAARAIAYLASQAPQGYQPAGLVAGKEPRRFSDAEIGKWERTVGPVKNPSQTITDAQHGKLSREGVQAIKAVYPQMYQELRQHVMDQIAEMDKKGLLKDMPYQQKLMLGVMLDAPADDTMAQPFIAMLQADRQGSPDKPKPGQAGAPAPAGGAPRQVGHRPMNMNTDVYQTEGAK